MKEPKTPSKLTRAQLRESLDSVPVSHLLGKSAARELTPKQRAFAIEVAKGSSGAEAYRKAYNTKAKPKTQGNQAHKLKARPDISAEIEAYQLALEGEAYRTPAALRALVVQTLAGVLVDPDAKQAVKVQAAKAIGAMTSVSLFTHRTETKIIKSSDDARAELMAQIRELSNASATDATIIDADADSLLAELAKSGESETHRTPTPQADDAESLAYMHTIPHEQSAIPHEQSPSSLGSHFDSDIDPENPDGETPPPSTQETPPSSFKTRPTGG
jgi:hypothetical protein